MPRPDLSQIPQHFHTYINLVPQDDLTMALREEWPPFIAFLKNIPVAKRDYRYAPEKWSIKEVLQHLIDCERVFVYRGLRFARLDSTLLPGFEENDFARNAKTQNRDWDELIKELEITRQSTEYLFLPLDEEQLNFYGNSNGKPMNALALGFVVVGHCNHHRRIIEERYL